MLHAASKVRKYSAAIQFALSALYGLLGCAELSQRSFIALEIRQVQLDTLSHHVVPFLASLGDSALASFYLQDVLNVRSSLLSTAGTMLGECYTNATFSKVLEFVLFKRREAASLTFLEARTELALLSLRHGALHSPPAPGTRARATARAHSPAALLFSKLNTIFFGYFNPEKSLFTW